MNQITSGIIVLLLLALAGLGVVHYKDLNTITSLENEKANLQTALDNCNANLKLKETVGTANDTLCTNQATNVAVVTTETNDKKKKLNDLSNAPVPCIKPKVETTIVTDEVIEKDEGTKVKEYLDDVVPDTLSGMLMAMPQQN